MDPRARPLRRRDVDPDPLRQFAAWFAEAQGTGIRAPEAMALATASAEGAPSVRFVLMKGFDERGFVFFTNYESRKGRELTANPQAALLFHWEALGRQVRIEGRVAPVAGEESDAYFYTRPRGAQVAALASAQSEPIPSRDELERAAAELRERYAADPPRRPESWGGFRLEPEVYELWQHREDRLHDRLRYRRDGGGWLIERLAP